MDPLTTAAASGLRARMQSLDMLANNLANTGTGGYKVDREFYSLYVSPEAAAAPDGTVSTLPVIERHWTDFSAGTLRATNNSLDVALAGSGFFAVQGSAGPLYTRNGSFSVAADGTLTGSGGLPVRAVGGGALHVQTGRPLEIAADGTVTQEGRTVGQLEVVDFDNPAALAKQGNTYFRAADSQPAKPAQAQVQQGKLEDSNVAAPESAVRLVVLLRQFEMLQKAASLGADMNRQAVEQVARPAS